MRKLMVCYFILFIFLLFIAFLPIGCVNSGYENNITHGKDVATGSPAPSANSALVRRECIYFKILADKETEQLSEREYMLLDVDDNSEIVKVSVDYYFDCTYCIKAEWLCQPVNSQTLTIYLDHIQPDTYNGYLLCDRSCEGISYIPDLNHTYNTEKYYHFNENERSNSLVDIDSGDTSIVFHVDLSRNNPCPYYTELAIRRGCFEKHTVWWKTILFSCSGNLLDINQDVAIHINL